MLRRWFAVAVAATVSIAFALIVLPRAFGGGGAVVEDGVPLRVLSANMRLGEGDPDSIATLVDELEVDVLSIQELTPRLGFRLGIALSDALPHRVLLAGPHSGGGGIYANRPLRDTSSPEPLPGGFVLPRALARFPGAPPTEILAVHTQPPTEWGATSWDDDLRALPPATARPLRLLVGDFNATLDHDELRELLGRGYTDAADAAGEGLAPTWPEHRRFPPLFGIDHVLVDDRIGIEAFSTHEIPGSDHRAVFAELILPAGG